MNSKNDWTSVGSRNHDWFIILKIYPWLEFTIEISSAFLMGASRCLFCFTLSLSQPLSLHLSLSPKSSTEGNHCSLLHVKHSCTGWEVGLKHLLFRLCFILPYLWKTSKREAINSVIETKRKVVDFLMPSFIKRLFNWSLCRCHQTWRRNIVHWFA